MKSTGIFLSVLALSSCLTSAPVLAQQTAARIITLVVPYAPGGALDYSGRQFAANLEVRTGQRVVVENRAGAGGYTGSEYVARSAPDGSTLLFNSLGVMHFKVFVKGLAVDLPRALVPIAQVARSDFFLMAATSVPARNLKEFLAYAKANPNKLNAGVLGNTSVQLDTVTFLRMAGVEMSIIPYNSVADVIRGMLSGDVHMHFVTLSVTEPHIKAGKIMPLAAATRERASVLADVPTLREQGIDFEAVAQTYTVLGPISMPPELVSQLNKSINASLQDNPGMKERLLKVGHILATASPEELSAKFLREAKQLQDAADRIGLKPQ